jgi:argininosuccinate lyase
MNKIVKSTPATKKSEKKPTSKYTSNENTYDVKDTKTQIKKTKSTAKDLLGSYYSIDPENFCSDILKMLKFEKNTYSIAINIFKAHVRMCTKKGIINDEEGQKLHIALEKSSSIIEGLVNSGKITKRSVYELVIDIVYEQIGVLAHTLEIAHSQAEHESAVVRIWMRDSLDHLDLGLQELQHILLEKAESYVKIVMPSYLHGKVFQPVSLAHYLMSYVEAISRDRERIAAGRERLNRSPLGAYMAAGNSFIEINRKVTARALNFSDILTNSMDAIYNRDCIPDFLSILSLCSLHLSIMAQDLIIWSNDHAGFISFSSKVLTKDRISAEARYPQIVEYIRSKTGIPIGGLMNVLTIIKGLSSGYSRDLSEMSEPLVDSYNSIISCVHAMTILISNFAVDRKRTKESSQSPYGFAPDILNWLLHHAKLEYNRAIEVTRQIISYSLENDVKPSLIELAILRKFEPKISKGIYSVLISSRAIIGRRSDGGSNPVHTRKIIRHYRRELDK